MQTGMAFPKFDLCSPPLLRLHYSSIQDSCEILFKRQHRGSSPLLQTSARYQPEDFETRPIYNVHQLFLMAAELESDPTETTPSQVGGHQH
ncbi:hypothetical protein TNCV_2030991 [Trichonephila clavipes]|nr:hypothetical protein TNCV_2030991 [Trichonephila clavipes]